MHGISKFLIDGVYDQPESVEEMCGYAIHMFTSYPGSHTTNDGVDE